jgi:hypothetical protein
MWQEGLMSYDEMRGMGMAKCGWLHGESAAGAGGCGKKPHGPGKKGTKRSLAVELHGLPIGVTLSGANRYDIKLLEAILRSIVMAYPEGANLYLDAGYTGAQKIVEGIGYKAHIRSRGEEKQEKEKNLRFKAGGRWWRRYAIHG